MAVQLLTASGQVNGEMLQPSDYIPLGGTLAKKDGLLNHLLVATPEQPNAAAGSQSGLYPAAFSVGIGDRRAFAADWNHAAGM